MDAFRFHMPTRFVFGPDAEMQSGTEIKNLGIAKLLIVYGKGSVLRSGLLQRVRQSLEDSGIRVWEIGNVMPNPVCGPVYEGIALCRLEGVDAVMGIGGGSSIDTAKAIALGTPYDGDFWDIFEAKAIPQKALPVIALPTIAAAGSESSNSAVITNELLTSKRGVNTHLNQPVLSLMNPKLTFSVPSEQKAFGIADMMSHIFERYFTNTRDVMLSDELCEGVLRTIIQSGLKAIQHQDDYASHADLMWAGTLAHNNTLSPGREQDWSCHRIGSAISAHYDAPHGGVLAVLFPHWMRYQLDHDKDRFARFAVKVMGVKKDAGDAHELAHEGINRLAGFFHSLGLKDKLSDYGMKEDDLLMIARDAPYSHEGTVGNFRPLNQDDVLAIYRLAL